MLKSAFVGLWICTMTAMALYLSRQGLPHVTMAASETDDVATERTKKSVVAVAVFKDGNVTGYFTARPFLFVDTDKSDAATLPLEALVRDGLHKIVYRATETDFTRTASLDVAGMEAELTASVNDRLGQPVIHHITLNSVSYLERE